MASIQKIFDMKIDLVCQVWFISANNKNKLLNVSKTYQYNLTLF